MANALFHSIRKKLVDWLTKETPSSDIPPMDFYRLKYEIRPGDVLLIEGRSRISKVIRTVTQSPWTHAALYIGKLHDIEDYRLRKVVAQHLENRENVRVIFEGMVDQGAIISPLSNYRKHHIRICRPIGLSPFDAQLVIEYVIKSVGKPYNVRQLFDLMRFLLPWTLLPRRWGSTLFKTVTGEPDSGICSSIIAEAFHSVQFPILPFIKPQEMGIEFIQKNPQLFTPKDFDYSPYFDIIKYPIITDPHESPYYRRLPWKTESEEKKIADEKLMTNIEKNIKKKKKFLERFLPHHKKDDNNHE